MSQTSEIEHPVSQVQEKDEATTQEVPSQGSTRLRLPFRVGRFRISIAFAVFLVINLILLSAYLWSSGGQTTRVRVEVRGNDFTAYVDGQLHARAELDAPAQGGLALTLQDTNNLPSLPSPRGIDYVRVTDLASGEVLFEDDFSSGYGPAWTDVSGAFSSEDGVLGIQGEGALVLTDRSWDNYAVDIEYKNIRGASILLRAQDRRTGVAYSLRPFRHYDNAFALLDEGQVMEHVPGALIEPGEGELIKSLVAMTLKAYPLTLLLLSLGFIAVAGLQFASVFSLLFRLIRARLPAAVFSLPSRLFRLTAAVFSLPFRLIRARLPAARFSLPFRLSRLPAALPWLAAGALAGGAFGVTLFLIYSYASQMPHVQDSVSYIFQAKILASGQLAAPPPPAIEAFNFEHPPFVVLSDGKWASVYPFGHPLALAVGLRLGAIWLIPPLLGAASVLIIFAIGKKVFNTRVGLLAALLLAASPFFYMTASNFMSHNTFVFYLLSSLLFLTMSDKRPILYSVLAGLFFGLAFNTRPLESLALILPFGFLLLSRLFPRERWRTGLRQVGGFMAGGLVMLVAFLLYNYGTTGDPFTSGFSAGGFGGNLGFGGEHSVNLGIRNAQVQMAFLLLVLNGWPQYIGLMFVLLPFVLGTRHRWDWFLLTCVVLVIAAYVFFIGHGIMYGPRYWYAATPFLILLAAHGADRAAVLLADAAAFVRRALFGGVGRPPVWAGVLVVYALIAALVGGGVYGWLLGNDVSWQADFVPNQATGLEGFNGVDDRLVKLVNDADLDNALVLVEGDCPNWQCYGSVFWLNSPALDGDVVFARDLEEYRAELLQAFPDRAVYAAKYNSLSLLPYGTTPSLSGMGEAEELPLAPIAREIALPTPTLMPIPPPRPTPNPVEAAQRDEERRRDLATIAEALQQYYDQRGAYPLAEGLQSFCRYRDLDAGCQLAEVLNPLPQDPSDGGTYWYLSDGTTFTLFAPMEGAAEPSQCPDPLPGPLISVEDIYCVQGSPEETS